MSTLNARFYRHAALIAGGLAAATAFFAVGAALHPPACTATPPFAPLSPVMLTCDQPFSISRYDRAKVLIDRQDASSYLITPADPWTQDSSFDFSLIDDVFGLERQRSIAIRAPSPAVFVAESEGSGATAIMTVREASDYAPPRILFALSGMSQVRFDGERFFSYLKTSTGPLPETSVWRYDAVSAAHSMVLEPLLGKTIGDFVPTFDPQTYALEEFWPGHPDGVGYAAGENNGIQLLAPQIGDAELSLRSPVFSKNTASIAVMSSAGDTAYFSDTLGGAVDVQSPPHPGKIIGVGFIGAENDVPVFWTRDAYWFSRWRNSDERAVTAGPEWVRQPVSDLVRVDSCGGKTFILSAHSLRDSSSVLLRSDETLTDFTLTEGCQPFVLEKDSHGGMNRILSVTDGKANVIFSSPNPLSIAGSN